MWCSFVAKLVCYWCLRYCICIWCQRCWSLVYYTDVVTFALKSARLGNNSDGVYTALGCDLVAVAKHILFLDAIWFVPFYFLIVLKLEKNWAHIFESLKRLLFMIYDALSVVFCWISSIWRLVSDTKCTTRGASQEIFYLALHNSNVNWFEFPSSSLCDGCHYKMEYCRCITQQFIHDN